MTLNWGRVDQWRESLLEGDITGIEREFKANGARGPSIKWRPAPGDQKQKQLKFLLEYWLDATRVFGAPSIGMIDPVRLAPALGYILIVDVVDGGRDFSYRLFGSFISTVSGFDMTRKPLSQHPASSYIREFSIALYRAIMVRKEPAWTFYGPAMAINTTAWERIVLPLVDEAGAVCRFLVGTLPIGLDGHPLRA
jgi:hypothetical protein